MIRNDDIPIGFTMELAQNQKSMAKFASLSEPARQSIIDGAKNMKSREEMQRYVETGFETR